MEQPKRIFVGRKAELEQFKQILKEPKGQAVIIASHKKGLGYE